MDRKVTSKQTPPLPVVLEVGQSNGFQVMGQVYADTVFKEFKAHLSKHNSGHFHQALEPQRETDE